MRPNMKSAAVLTILLAAQACANILLPFVQPTCDFSLSKHQGCLSGQMCIANNTCIPAKRLADLQLRDSAPRPDGRCGKGFDGATCDPEGEYGGCCSQYGFCGNEEGHCLKSNGCQSGCDDDGGDLPPTSTAVADSSGAQSSEPVMGSPTAAPSPDGDGPTTTDGTCGADNGSTICGDWPRGSCCSMYGFCGNSSTHCGEGCQSGPCDQDAASPAPGPKPAMANANPGTLKVVGDSGVPAMHAGLLPNGRVVFLDKVEDYSKLNLWNGHYAYSSEYDPATNEGVPLAYKTNAFCAGGIFLANGTFMSIGGNGPLVDIDDSVGDGFAGLRWLTRSIDDDSLNGQDWIETNDKLDTDRWYASAQTMPDGTIFVASGSLNDLDPRVRANNNPTYEILNRDGISNGESIPMGILYKADAYYMYPFIHLLNDGTLFVFVSRFSEIFDVGKNKTVKTFDELPGTYRTYPNIGGSVLLPLSSANGWDADVIICGGGSYQDITSPTDPSCGRIRPQQENAKWEMDSMPQGRGMVEGTLLPDGSVVWVNGANTGAQGFELAEDPTLEVLIYDPAAELGKRWTTGPKSDIPRLYHSVALLLLDGTLMIAGSNPVQMPKLEPDAEDPYATEFRVEIYTPPYLSGDNANRRPTNIVLSTLNLKSDSSTFDISFNAPEGAKEVKLALYHGGFVTHSLHMGHRMLFLDTEGFKSGEKEQKITVTAPPNSNVAPPGPYVVYVVVDGVPGVGQFVMVS